jgi:hypothetical protein
MKKILTIVILLLIGLTVLGGYFFPAALGPLLNLLIDWGILLLGTAGLIGVYYLIKSHVGQVARQEKRFVLSIVLLAAFSTTLILGLFLSIEDPLFIDLMINIQTPVETSLLAILAVVLMTASFRLISTRGWTPMSIAFLTSAVISLALNVGAVNFALGNEVTAVINYLRRLPLIGARGILLGMALGGLIVGLRVLLTIDKPYGES